MTPKRLREIEQHANLCDYSENWATEDAATMIRELLAEIDRLQRESDVKDVRILETLIRLERRGIS